MMNTFEFEAQRADGYPMSGTLNATSAANAQDQLTALGLRVITLRPAVTPARRVHLNTEDLSLLNEQLIQLTTAGLPMERGLSLLADDLKRSPVKSAMQSLSADLSSGTPLDAAIAARRTEFPPIYARLIDAGIRTGNLPGVLHGFGRHLETVSRMKNELWRACAYPLVVLGAFGLLMIFLSYFVLPQYFSVIRGMGATSFNWRTGERTRHTLTLPLAADVLYAIGHVMPFLLGGLALAIIVIWTTWRLLKSMGREGPFVDSVILRIPLLGPAMRHSYVSRWIDTVAIGVRSGLDLPLSIQLAGQVIALPSLERDGKVLTDLLASGQGLDRAPKLHCVPRSVPPAIELASQMGRLSPLLDAMSRDYTRQTEQRVRMIPATLMPILIVLIGLCAGVIIYGLWTPLVRLINSMSGSW